MIAKAIVVLLLAVNLAFVAWLVVGLKQLNWRTVGGSKDSPPPTANGAADTGPREDASGRQLLPSLQSSPASVSVPSTPFARLYAEDPRTFAASLRAIHCPEETVKDILTAEINRRYRAQEAALHPKPADHVPFGWSAQTSEAKLLERRQQASALAREKAALLREALGYEAPVAMPLYAMSSSDVRFESSLAELPPEKRVLARQADSDYWTAVQSLQARTKGFWLPDDLAELKRLKQVRQQSIGAPRNP